MAATRERDFSNLYEDYFDRAPVAAGFYEPPAGAPPARGLPGPTTSEARVVVGVDFGTTFTGIAMIQIKGGAGAETPSIENIIVHQEWPLAGSTKVPSAVSYSPSPNGQSQWGYDIESSSVVMRWTKLELHRASLGDEIKRLEAIVRGFNVMSGFLADAENRSQQNDTPKHLRLDAGDIMADLLDKVVREWYAKVHSTMSALFSKVPLDIVITHPSQWTYGGKNQTVRSILHAFPKARFPMRRHVFLVPEPEACALYTATCAIASDRGRILPGDCFVVCDAGGGTVDLVAYRLESASPFGITPVTPPVCVHGGASQIDRDFFKFLLDVLEPVGLDPEDLAPGAHYVLEPLAEELLSRFLPIKHLFEGEDDDVGFVLPDGCVALDNDFARSRVVNDSLKLTLDDMKDRIFGPTIRKVKKFITMQVTNLEARAEHYHITHIFMSGGFSSSKYLISEVENWARMKNIQVELGQDCWGAVVRGAVMKGAGIGADLPRVSTLCPRSYGVVVDRPYMDYLQFNDGDVASIKGRGLMVQSQIMWLASVGDLIPADEPLVLTQEVDYQTRSRHSRRTFDIPFIASSANIRDRAKRQEDSQAARDEERLLRVTPSDIDKGDWNSNVAKLIIEATIKNNVKVRVFGAVSKKVMATCDLLL